MTLRHAPRHVQGLPTLTEVIELPAAASAAASATPPPAADRRAPVARPIDEAELVARVLVELQHYVGLTLEERMREVVEPALALAAATLVRELRTEIAATLHDVVARSVIDELERQRRAETLAGP